MPFIWVAFTYFYKCRFLVLSDISQVSRIGMLGEIEPHFYYFMEIKNFTKGVFSCKFDY